jgi:hypothetical protein
MRGGLPVAFLVVGLFGGCGRIGYSPLASNGGNAATGGVGTGGASGSGGRAGSGASGGASGAGGAAGSSGTGGVGGGSGAGGVGGGSGSSGVGGGGAAGTSAGGIGGTTVDGGAACATMTFNGHTYAFCDGPFAWADANNDCAAKGMRLVRIDDAAENTWVQMTAFAGIASTSSIYWPWIGGTDQAVVGEWRWTDGALFWMGSSNGSAQGGLYSNWVAGSPTSGGTATDCAILQHAAFWTDFDCTRLERYVCEQY